MKVSGVVLLKPNFASVTKVFQIEKGRPMTEDNTDRLARKAMPCQSPPLGSTSLQLS